MLLPAVIMLCLGGVDCSNGLYFETNYTQLLPFR